jgi:16S rRNA (cytosine1402-N4)-methyltransferase
MEFKHVPVMLEECMQALNLKDNGNYFDGALGGGGHSGEIFERTYLNGALIATDRDEEAIRQASKSLAGYGSRFTAVKDNFKNFNVILESLNITEIDGAIIDLGVSSYQLDNRERGFSYMADDVKLDMRMDKSSTFTAYELVNEYSENRIKYILETYGEEKFAKNIAKNIVLKRQESPIKTCGELVEIIKKSIPLKFQKDGHPAKRTFQAIRIALNEELDGLDKAIKDVIGKLKSGGRIAILTFHSLEDRIVKNVFNDLSTSCICDKRYPCVCNRKQIVKIVNKKPITASQDEMLENSRSKCAKLRIAEKL